jgi:hypothetical protein
MEEARNDRRLTSEELQAVKLKVQRRGLNVWFEKTTRAYKGIHRVSRFPHEEDLPSTLDDGPSYLGKDIEAWAIRAMIGDDERNQKIARQILREYFSGRYEKPPLLPWGRANKDGHHLKGDNFYNVRVKDPKVKNGVNLSLKVFVYRDFDNSPQTYSWPPPGEDIDW